MAKPLKKPDSTFTTDTGLLSGEPSPTVEAQPTTSEPENTSPALFDATGLVSPSDATAKAEMPEAPPQKSTRGRHPNNCTCDKCKSKKKAAKKSPTQEEAQGMASAQLIVGALDLLRGTIAGGECPQGAVTRDMTIAAWCEYLEQNGWEVPAWVQVGVISTMYVAPAFHTERGRGVLSGTWAKVKAAYIKWRG